VLGRLRRRIWLIRAGIDRLEYRRHDARQRRNGCAYPGSTYVIRPNGTVLPCPFWEEQALARFPDATHDQIASAPLLEQIRAGLASGSWVGSCATCGHRRDAFYRPASSETSAEIEVSAPAVPEAVNGALQTSGRSG
jgi:MoaA/NifB/PqqE/SkfB family radical SAM enzyme